MNEVLQQILTQWGMVGVLAIAAGYIIWDNYKANKEREKLFHEKMATSDSKGQIYDTLKRVSERLTSIETKMELNRTELDAKIQQLDDRISKQHPSIHDENQRMHAVSKISPAIYSLLDTDMDDCGADHMFVAMYHNGNKSVCGLPFMKFDVVCEKYDPLTYMHDTELANEYKDEDLMRHNQLPGAMFQCDVLKFDLTDPQCPLQTIDQIMYGRAMKRKIKYLVLGVFRDKSNLPHGFLGAYSFDRHLDVESFKETLYNLEAIYNNLA